MVAVAGKASWPISVRVLGIVTFVKDVHSSNAEAPILVTLFGIVTLVKEVHLLNALSPIDRKSVV